MKSAVLKELNAPLSIENLTVPDPGYGQALVKIAASGICRTQWGEIKGKRGADRYLPHCLGHEGAGIVEAVGQGVTKVRRGDRVILSWMKGSGINASAVQYLLGDEKINAGALTTFNEYTVASENRLTPIRKDMPLDKAALIGCAISTGAGAIFNTAKVKPGNSVAVFGAGGVGLSAIQASALSLANPIIAVDISEANLVRAQEFGATRIIHAKKEDPVSTIRELTANLGADAAVESAGVRASMEQAFDCVRRGGLAVLIGNLPYQEKISIDPFELICGKRIVGSWGGETDPDKDFPRYVDLYCSGKLKLDELITHRFKLEEINRAFDLMEQGALGRAIIEFS